MKSLAMMVPNQILGCAQGKLYSLTEVTLVFGEMVHELKDAGIVTRPGLETHRFVAAPAQLRHMAETLKIWADNAEESIKTETDNFGKEPAPADPAPAAADAQAAPGDPAPEADAATDAAPVAPEEGSAQ